MPISPADNAPWGFAEWAIGGLTTMLVSIGAFVWRLTLRLETIEASLTRQQLDLEQTRQATEVAVGRLGERFAQMQDEHYRLRESIGALPTRVDMRSLEEHIGERLDALATRLDRMIDA